MNTERTTISILTPTYKDLQKVAAHYTRKLKTTITPPKAVDLLVAEKVKHLNVEGEEKK